MDYKTERRCYAIFLEVLDNLPHDKVILNKDTNKYDKMAVVNIETK